MEERKQRAQYSETMPVNFHMRRTADLNIAGSPLLVHQKLVWQVLLDGSISRIMNLQLGNLIGQTVG